MTDDARHDAEPLIAYVYGDDVPPDFAVLAACGFTIVCLDTTAPWYREEMLATARSAGLEVVAFAMRHIAGPERKRRDTGTFRAVP